MFNRKLMMLLILLVGLLAVSASAAADNVSDEILKVSENQAINQTDDGQVSVEEDGTFTELQEKIYSAGEGATIVLDRDYFYDDGFEPIGIELNKSITIDGNNHVIDAKSKAAIFYASDHPGGFHRTAVLF